MKHNFGGKQVRFKILQNFTVAFFKLGLPTPHRGVGDLLLLFWQWEKCGDMIMLLPAQTRKRCYGCCHSSFYYSYKQMLEGFITLFLAL